MTEISAADLAEFCYFPMDLFPTGPAASCHVDEWLVSFSLPTKLSTLPKDGPYPSTGNPRIEYQVFRQDHDRGRGMAYDMNTPEHPQDSSTDELEVAALLEQLASGVDNAADQLMPLVYDRLHGLAQKMLRNESPGHTLQPTALVNEAYIRMLGQSQVNWQGKTHFFAIGARMMRRILVDHARRKLSQKRGGGLHRICLEDDLCISQRSDEDVLAIEDALSKLAELDPRQAQIVELRFYGGLTVEEVAEVLKVSKRTVESDWTMLRAWLRRELTSEHST